MRTTHRLLAGDARAVLPGLDRPVHLVVTSPPYPMVALWDEPFRATDPAVGAALDRGDAAGAWEAMHASLDRVWAACAAALVPGGMLCVNVGDAVRTVGGRFALWPNHARVTQAMLRLGLTALPDIVWRKPTNAPNKFMGSGMLPGGAYVTYEHEHVGIFRKPGPRAFDRAARARSAYFWEERNRWFSDLWDGLPGVRQGRGDGRRSAAFPFELPWRLVHMYSLLGETVLDPFAGTGTTLAAALAAGRSSVGVEIDPALAAAVPTTLADVRGHAREPHRLAEHRAFVADRRCRYVSRVYQLPVVTRQEIDAEVWTVAALDDAGEGVWAAGHRLAGA